MMALVDFDRLATMYAQELQAEGMDLSARVSASAVIADLARLAGVPAPWFIDEGYEPQYPEGA